MYRNRKTSGRTQYFEDPASTYILANDIIDEYFTPGDEHAKNHHRIKQEYNKKNPGEPAILTSFQKAIVIALNYCLITQLNTLIHKYQPRRRLEGIMVILAALTFVTSIIETSRGRTILIGFLFLMNIIISENSSE